MSKLEQLLETFRNDKENSTYANGTHRFDKEIVWIEEMIRNYAEALNMTTDEVVDIMERRINMTPQEACVQAFENGRKKGNAEGYARGKAEAFAEAGDLISRKALMAELEELKSPLYGYGDFDYGVESAIFKLENAPVVVAQPVKRGRWILEKGCSVKSGYECSVCRKTRWFYKDVPQVFAYCPNCGADMRGEGDA